MGPLQLRVANADSNDRRSVVVLLSGGLDSATVLAMARASGLACHALSVDYGQRHRWELDSAARVASSLGAASHRVVRVDLRAIGGSALTGHAAVPKGRTEPEIGGGIPATYVPARNLVFLSIGVGLAEVVGAAELHVGVNAVDYSGYPDCRPEFVGAFQRAADLATKAGVEGRGVAVRAPILAMTKAEIIREGVRLGVDYSLTRSCYDPDERGRACGACDACTIRRRGFDAAGVPDPTDYAEVGSD
ncbi:MAG: 7-cyano-7-deazaguanine synthase QueC [Phycisphaeraceae bacterium]|nr:7-cyano-7-deazaguanine synthase QueC [Phycisphaeraceae bacterium]